MQHERVFPTPSECTYSHQNDYAHVGFCPCNSITLQIEYFGAQCPSLLPNCLRLNLTLPFRLQDSLTVDWLILSVWGFHPLSKASYMGALHGTSTSPSSSKVLFNHPCYPMSTLKPNVTASAPRLANGGVVSSFPCGVSTHYLKRPTWTHCQAPKIFCKH